MDQGLVVLAIYVLPVVIIAVWYVTSRGRKTRRARGVYLESLESGLMEPASLHPVIDPARCLGCATCVKACPEKNVLGVIENKARLVSPASCIGHGACKVACPTNAIELVFGTATRGVDIPLVGEDFQTNVPGIYIAGELGGMGLIRNAIEQGRQAVEAICRNGRRGGKDRLDLLIVGAGPAGISAAMGATELGLRFQIVEQDSVGGTIAHYPRGKVVMTAPARLPIIGEFKFGETSKERLMEFWTDVIKRARLKVHTGVRIDAIAAEGDSLIATCSRGRIRAANILLTIGRRGTPRKLGVPGEELCKVVYRLVDPEQYRGQRVAVVGGGDSALEAAISLSEEPGTEVLLSYRGEAFNRVKAKNRERLAAAEDVGRLRVEMSSTLSQITDSSIRLATESGEEDIGNDAVIICAGGILPTAFLEAAGIEVETHYGRVHAR